MPRTFSKVCIIAGKVLVGTVLAVSVNTVVGIGGNEGDQGHFILRQGTSLIGADNGDGSQSLDGRKDTDNGVVLCHVGDRPRVGHGDDSFKTFGDHGNGANQGNGERIDSIQSSDEESDTPCNGSNDSNEAGEDLGDIVDLFQNRCFLFFLGIDKLVNLSDLSVVTGGNDNTDTRTLSDKCSREEHILAVTQRNLGRVSIFTGDGSRGLLNGDGFTGQGSFEGSNVVGLQDTDVTRDTITGSKDNNITRNNLDGWHLAFLAVSDAHGITGEHILQGFGGLLGGTFLVDTNGGVEGDDEGNETNFNEVRQTTFRIRGSDTLGEGDNGNKDEDTNEDVAHLFPDTLKKGDLLLLRELVRTILFETSLGLGSGQTSLAKVSVQTEVGNGLFLCHDMVSRGGNLGGTRIDFSSFGGHGTVET
mmetsp:Transcript_784/g.1747  ORF Transcript_784/g.1747 Transcript_784/m.1747 type:complete len:418 (-) Transcript_784:77-1330(-)